MKFLGHNEPPDMAETAGEITQDLGAWMADHPVIGTEEDARAAKVYIDRGSLGLRDLDDERRRQVDPLNERVKAINGHYQGPRQLLEKVLSELKMRLGRFIAGEEEKRQAAAAAARMAADDAARMAREAERVEREAIRGASVGELDVNIAGVTADADAAFADYKKAERQAQVAERETKVKIGGGFTRAIGLRKTEILEIENVGRALAQLGITPDIYEAIIKSARAYRKLHGKLPEGVSVKEERRM